LSRSSGTDRCENIVNDVINFLHDYRNRGRRKRCLDAWLQQRTRQEKLSYGNLKNKNKIFPKLFQKKAVPHKSKVGPNKLKVGPNKLKVCQNKLKVCPNKLKVGPNKLIVGPKVKSQSKQVEVAPAPREVGQMTFWFVLQQI